MDQLQDVARCLLAAGYANVPEGKGQYLLYVDPKTSSLMSKRWTGSFFDDKELITDTPVRPNSTASYLINPSTRLVICISSKSTIRVLQYDEEEEKWDDVDTKQPHVVHPEGKLTAFSRADNFLRIIYQDHSGRLIYLNKSFQPLALPVDLVAGSPLSSAVVNEQIYVFYISSRDNYVHCVTEARPGNWSDEILAKHAFDQIPKQFVVPVDPKSGGFEVYVLTEENALLRIAKSQMSILGKIDATGKFTSARSVDRCCNDAWNGTLTRDLLKTYLALDPSIIDTPGGDKSVTPLAAASWRGHLDAVKLLLREGANPNAISPKKRTPLFYLTKRSPDRNRLGIVRALLDAGANVDECYPENDLNTPLMNAIGVVADKEVVHELLKRGASLTARNAHGQTAKMLAEGTKMEDDFLKWTERTPSELETRLVDFVVALLVLIITYTNNELIRHVFNQVITEVTIRLDEIDSTDNENAPQGAAKSEFKAIGASVSTD